MARQVQYTFKGTTKIIAFSYDRFNDLYEAAAAAEGIDLSGFLAMEQQVAKTAKDKAAIKNFRQQAFTNMGFSNISFLRDET
ncbi:DUF2960 domain-containing protein [Arsukibacterium indicum]|uniref:DUF2960 domain-containing protein n=1 Tax=Arsukibacterium indicum TaxID=2848612 RepID=A0ABS6MMB5_9GAMM|nr:DUF2960 domain-containing protein [Arsukibacterium indicum]MBV2129942.1 DUF2960 domain-containing protein [Arsukibacterium indicum]